MRGGDLPLTGLHGDNVSMAMRPKSHALCVFLLLLLLAHAPQYNFCSSIDCPTIQDPGLPVEEGEKTLTNVSDLTTSCVAVLAARNWGLPCFVWHAMARYDGPTLLAYVCVTACTFMSIPLRSITFALLRHLSSAPAFCFRRCSLPSNLDSSL